MNILLFVLLCGIVFADDIADALKRVKPLAVRSLTPQSDNPNTPYPLYGRAAITSKIFFFFCRRVFDGFSSKLRNRLFTCCDCARCVLERRLLMIVLFVCNEFEKNNALLSLRDEFRHQIFIYSCLLTYLILIRCLIVTVPLIYSSSL